MEMTGTGNHRFSTPDSITSGVIHFWGFLLAIAGTAVLIVFTALRGADPWKIVSFCIYGAGLIMLYGASAAYHTFYVSEKVHRTLRKLDHCMIYVLIAGSYTPFCLVTLNGALGWTLLTIIWTLAIVGIIIKICWIDAPKWVSSICYLFMGWIIVLYVGPLQAAFGSSALFWLVAGGAFYTIGAILYAAKPLRFQTQFFGSHELFHILILAGSACHYYLMFNYVM